MFQSFFIKNVCSLDHKALYMCLKHRAPPYLESFAQQNEHKKIKKCNMLQRRAGKLTIRPRFTLCKEIHEVTIVPRTPSKEITEPIMLFCKISSNLRI